MLHSLPVSDPHRLVVVTKLGRIVSSLLFVTQPSDPVSVAIAAAVLTTAALAAAAIPARHVLIR